MPNFFINDTMYNSEELVRVCLDGLCINVHVKGRELPFIHKWDTALDAIHAWNIIKQQQMGMASSKP